VPAQPSRRRRIPPPTFLALGLLGAIAVGGSLLRLPIAHAGTTVGWLDALFTATSAVCVTGLATVDTGTRFTLFGQAVILVLIQLGGLGVMTVGTVVLAALGQRPTTVMRELLRGYVGHAPTIRARDVFRTIVVATLTIELVGAALLLLAFASEMPVGRAVWMAVFHSVSAFCNAGFSLLPDNLVRHAGRPLVLLTVMALIVGGGLGFVVLVELGNWLRSRRDAAGLPFRLSLHSRVVLVGSAVAVAGGAAAILAFEWTHALAGRPLGEKLLIGAFQSVTARTAGFNTIDLAAVGNPTLMVLMLLMFVGAGPGSTAGGIKLTSAASLLALVRHRLRGGREPRLFGRAVGESTLQRAVVLATLALVLIGVAVAAIEAFGPRHLSDPAVAHADFLPVLFEAVSAFGTVGLSMDLTPLLPAGGKVVIMVLMFVGRLGPLWLMDFFQHLPPPPPVRHAPEELMVG
jgi:trk system potassium uptake protein TrkH